MTPSVICGSGEAGAIVWTPDPTMLNSMVSAPTLPLASVIACRSEPGPVSAVVVTVYVVAEAADSASRPVARNTPIVFMGSPCS